MDISRPQRHPLKQREVYVNDGDGIADLQGREASHGLSGTSLPDSEEFLKRHPVQVRNFQRAQLLQNFLKSMEPRRLGRHEGSYSTLGRDPAQCHLSEIEILNIKDVMFS